MGDHNIIEQFSVVKNELSDEIPKKSAVYLYQQINRNNLPVLYVKLEKIEVNNLKGVKESTPYFEKTTQPNNISSPPNKIIKNIHNNSYEANSGKDRGSALDNVSVVKNIQGISNPKITRPNITSCPENRRHIISKNNNQETMAKDFLLTTKKEIHESVNKTASKYLFKINKKKIEEKFQIKQEEIHIDDVQCTSRVSADRLPKSSNIKTTVPNQTKPSFFNGTGVLHAPLRTNPTLQSILSDIVLLRREYKSNDESLLDEEVDRMRAKYNLPSLRDSDYFGTSDSELAECSSQGSDDDLVSNDTSKLNRKDVQGVLKISRQVSNNDEDSDRLVIDESVYEQINKPESKTHNINTVEVNGTVLDIDPEIPECPACAKVFKSCNTLKQHLKICPLLTPLSTKNCDIKIDQVFSVQPAIPNQQTVPCFVSTCSFKGLQTEIQEHLLKEHSNYYSIRKNVKKPRLQDVEVIEIDDDDDDDE